MVHRLNLNGEKTVPPDRNYARSTAVPFLLLIAQTVATFSLRVTRTSDYLRAVTTMTTRDKLSEQVARKSLEYFVQNGQRIFSKIAGKFPPKSQNYIQNH